MTGSERFPRNMPFKPSPAFITWFIIDYILFIVPILCCCMIPILLADVADLLLVTAILGGIAAVTVFFVLWTRLYYDTMSYEIHDDELRWRRGVWFRTTGIVPYNRITNLDLKQGPVMRRLGISTISIQTAGYSGQAVPEIRIEAIENAEELRELLRSAVRNCSFAGDGTGTGVHVQAAGATAEPAGTAALILDELKKIRVLLEQQKK